jgi:hypothetical protein
MADLEFALLAVTIAAGIELGHPDHQLCDRSRAAPFPAPDSAGDLLNAGANLVRAQKLAGHLDPKTTANYDRRDRSVQRSTQSCPR